MRVMLCGGTGFIGTALSEALLERGDEVWIVTRRLPAAPASGLLYVTWEEWADHPERWSGVDAIVSLAGETIGQRWTDEAKRRILISRTQTALHIADIVKRMPQPPKVLVNASGISLYGHSYSPIVKPKPAPKPEKPKKKKRRNEIGNWMEEWEQQQGGATQPSPVPESERLGIRGFTYGVRPLESAEPEAVVSSDAPTGVSPAPEPNEKPPAEELGWFHENSPAQPEDLLGRTVVAWEEAVDQIPVDRIVKLRISLVLGRGGGSFPLLRLPYRLFFGGRMGKGTQGFPWIHLDDMVALILFCLDHPELSGPVNAVAPDPVNNDTFGRTLAKVTRRPHWFHVPSSLLRLALGEQSDLLLTGQHAYPYKALEHGFTFAFPRLEDALRDLTGRHSRERA